MDLSDVDSTEELSDEQVLDLLTDADEEEVEERKDEVAEGRGGDGENPSVRGEEGRSVAVTDRRNDSEVQKAHHTLRMIIAAGQGQAHEAGKHVRELYDAGAFKKPDVRSALSDQRAAGDFYSTVVDADGGILLPTEVRDNIQELADQVGVARQIADTFENVRGSIRQPAGTGVEDQADFVDEGGEITASKRAFQSVLLNPKKVAQIIPWSYEAQIELAPQILEDVQEALARSFTRAEDDALFNGDGSSNYNDIDGLFSANKNVPTTTIGTTGDDDPADIGPDELILQQNELDEGARDKENLYYVFHPDLRAIFQTKKDNNGQYLFDFVENEDGPDELKGISVLYTEVLPGQGSNASTQFGSLVNGRYIQMALGEDMTTEELRQGQIKDADTGDTINLATQDLRALKGRAFFDLDFNFDTAAANFQTNS
jgi:HK97 family phage major capsid protein